MSYILSALVALLVSASAVLFVPKYEVIEMPKVVEVPVSLGADTVNPIAGVIYTLAGSGVSASATSVILTTLTVPQTGYELLDADFSSTFYITLEPGSRTRQEIVSCTTVAQNADNSATLSGCTRGLLPYTPFTASSTYQFAHAGGTSVVFSNPPQLYNQFAAKDNDETITGQWIFPSSTASWPRSAASSTSLTGADTALLAPIYYVNSVASSGAPDATEAVKGIAELATISETAAGTATGTTGANLVPQNKYFNATSSATTTIPITMSNGLISPTFISTSSQYAWTGTSSFSNVTSITLSTATSTATSTDIFNLLPAGVIQMYAATGTAPAGWLFADGTEYTTSTYPRLFQVIAYTYGGSTSTFKVPNFKHNFPMGLDSAVASSTPIGTTGGLATTTISVNTIAAGGQGTGGGGSGFMMFTGGTGGQINSTGTNNILPPYIVTNFIIKY